MTSLEKVQRANNEPGIHVIYPSNDSNALDDDYDQYLSLPVDDMRMSDDKAVEIYGMSNPELYYKLLAYNNDGPVTEGFVSGDGDVDPSRIDAAVLDRINHPTDEDIEKAKQAIEERDHTTVVIYPFNAEMPYSLPDLEKLWADYNCLSFEKQKHSDEHSYALFGYDVRNMYEINRNILISLIDKSDTHEVKLAEAESRYERKLNWIRENADDELILQKEILNSYSTALQGNVYEHMRATDILEAVSDIINVDDNLTDDLPGFTPYLTPTEIEDYFEDDGLSSDASTFLEEYKKALAVGLCEFDGEEYKKRILELYSQKKNQTHTIKVDEALVSLGWNPNVEPNEKGFSHARERIASYMRESNKVHIVDVQNITSLDESKRSLDEHMNKAMYPVYIVLNYTNTAAGNLINFAKGSKYSHACIAFNDALNPMYTYVTGGLAFETLEQYVHKFKDSTCKVIATFVTKVQLDKIKANLAYYVANKEKTKYATGNLFNILFNRKKKDEYSLKQVCSQFVNQLLTLANVNIFDGKSNNLISPDDFDKSKNTKLYVVYEGLVRDYDPRKTSGIIQTLTMKKTGMVTKKYTMKEAAEVLSKTNLIEHLRLVECNSMEIEANLILEKIHDLVTPESVLVEAKKFPLRINSKGIVVDLPVRLEEQYQEIHKTLQVYEKEGSFEQMKPELARLWYLNLVAERKIKVKTNKGKTDDAKKIRDVRARIMNDFKKYLTVVLKNDKEFDFATYFEKSQYNDRSLFVDRETLLYSGQAIAKVVKSVLGK